MNESVTRRAALVRAGAAAMLVPGVARAAAPAGTAFSWNWLVARAGALAARAYVAPPPPAKGSSAVTYDTLNHIAYRDDRTVWGTNGIPGVRFFPLNKYAHTPVEIALVENGRARPFPFRRDLFTGADQIPAGVEGFSGFRLMNPNNVGDWFAMQGASYFRSAGALDQYGLSARALAIDTGLSSPEEFPRFTHLWLEPAGTNALTIYALLDSPSVAGAWRIVVRRTDEGVTQDISCAMQFRRAVARLGVAPCTSMFWYGEADRPQAVDWRPEIHDSDGLAMLSGTGERIWRPLQNPRQSVTNSFADTDPKGFGLFQRDRNFDHYQDDGIFYEKRPNLWVEPKGAWGKGAVTLFEMATGGETDDNIVAFWTPATKTAPGMRLALDYRLRWTATEPLPGARVTDLWRGTAGIPGQPPIPHATRIVIDFAGPALKGLGRTSGVTADVTFDRGKPLSVSVYPVVGRNETWRMIVEASETDGKPTNMRACLRSGGTALTETLLYQII
ncbi:glucan biosynthesis protein [Sphingomonas nostoxanthinifaciens]|uniref:glucan biosynthesis protein n=1 Tax=Sphingomonas nostoxanthinifaciens TaxID=2872652 RepID=UPI001CC1ED83|nr:glucan biosynthesis protein [Sphingomonas nostoxanthinifaciens]UAK23427.1 glucan biosynthesis protein [Sphingomonas nostoxanthinifaciens]